MTKLGKAARSQHRRPRDLYQEVTDRILAMLDAGTVPWRNPIRRSQHGDGFPKNLNSQKRYRGVNVFLLAMTAWAEGFESDYWLTYKQAQKLGGQVRKGEKSSMVVFWQQVEKRDRETDEKITMPVLKQYRVFNVVQCEGIQAPDDFESKGDPFVPIEEAERIAQCYFGGPKVNIRGTKAYYRPSTDTVQIATPKRFESPESYYCTLFHEFCHSTGHSSRLNRGLDVNPSTPFGSPDYSKEELIAEMGAAFLAANAGISPPTIEQSAAYIDGWREKLRGDKKLVINAAAAGQKAADWILGDRPD